MALVWTELDGPDQEEQVALLMHMASLYSGRLDVARLAQRPEGSPSCEAFGECVKRGYVDAEGWVTAVGREYLGEVQSSQEPGR